MRLLDSALSTKKTWSKELSSISDQPEPPQETSRPKNWPHGEHHQIARYYWAKLWNLKLDQTWQELSDIEEKYKNLPDSLPNLLRFEYLNRLISAKKVTLEEVFKRGQEILNQQ